MQHRNGSVDRPLRLGGAAGWELDGPDGVAVLVVLRDHGWREEREHSNAGKEPAGDATEHRSAPDWTYGATDVVSNRTV
jgi:hypothetical protein